MQHQLNLKMVKFRPPFPDNAGMPKTYTGELIARRLLEMDRTQEWLAEKVGVSINAVSKWTRTGKISRENAVLAAKALGITVGELLQEQPEDMKADKNKEPSLQLVYLTDEEMKLITMYRESTEMGRAMLMAAAESVQKINKNDKSSHQA